MIQENIKEELRADKLAEKFAGELLTSKDIGIMQAADVYLDIKKITFDAILRTNKLRNK